MNQPGAAALLVLACMTSAASADTEPWPIETEHPRAPVTATEIPDKCKVYVPTEKDADVVIWSKALSFAGCVQDATVFEVSDPDELRPMLLELTRALAPTLALYLSIIQYGPEPVQVRAAYQIGMMYVALVTRARSSIVLADGEMSDPEAVREYRDLHDSLEPMLQRPIHTARLVFIMVDRVARENPSIAPDPVTKQMVRSARAMLLLLDRQETETKIGRR
ncbi:MAG TPA: hypothetical protein VLB44_22540 [Kofleriaceae bacterium]|nr:hypothetical protein [Kofleriaceae bacterium]